jgi:hypothetical protein
VLSLLFFRGAGGQVFPVGLRLMTARQEFGSKTPNETVWLGGPNGVDFSSYMGAGETISGVSANCVVWSGTDASPTSVLSGAPAAVGNVVKQLVTGGVAGVIYLVQLVATTSVGQILTIGGYLSVVAAQPG